MPIMWTSEREDGSTMKVDIEEVQNRLLAAAEEEQVCLMAPQEAEAVWDYMDDLEKRTSRSEWAWVVLGVLCFWALFFFGGGGRLAMP